MQKEVVKQIEIYLDELKYDRAKEIFSNIAEGKMLRSRLIEAISGVDEKSIKLAATIELIHTASLLHDDVIDRADSRRGLPSINAKYGNIYAVMLGDILYSKAFSELSLMDKEISRSVSQAVCQLSIGEMMDVDYSKTFNKDLEIYNKIIYLKTGVLIEVASKCAAILSGKDKQNLSIYGKNIGIAFQIADDILDATADSKTLGKPAFSDFREGKSTLPFIILYSKLPEDDATKLVGLCGKEFDSTQEAWIKSKFEEFGIIELAKQEAFRLIEEALLYAKDEKGLVEIAKKMVDRKF
ncbi:MAG: polyprenyl synthetase family protein [Campylobacterales bacterium]